MLHILPPAPHCGPRKMSQKKIVSCGCRQRDELSRERAKLQQEVAVEAVGVGDPN